VKIILETTDPSEIAQFASFVAYGPAQVIGAAPPQVPQAMAPAALPPNPPQTPSASGAPGAVPMTPPASTSMPGAAPATTMPAATPPAGATGAIDEAACRNAMNAWVKRPGNSAASARAVLQQFGLAAIKGMPANLYQPVYEAFTK
jgi:hypothetical protein